MCKTTVQKAAVIINYKLVYSDEKGSYSISACCSQGSSNLKEVSVDNITTDAKTAHNLLDKLVNLCILPNELSYAIQDLTTS